MAVIIVFNTERNDDNLMLTLPYKQEALTTMEAHKRLGEYLRNPHYTLVYAQIEYNFAAYKFVGANND